MMTIKNFSRSINKQKQFQKVIQYYSIFIAKEKAFEDLSSDYDEEFPSAFARYKKEIILLKKEKEKLMTKANHSDMFTKRIHYLEAEVGPMDEEQVKRHHSDYMAKLAEAGAGEEA